MDFRFADTLGITIDLIALRTGSQPFSIHLYQHQGLFAASQNGIGNQNDPSAQFRYFFDEARGKNSDLVLTPEYSCSWKNIFEIIGNENLWPAPGKLWAIGCESVSKSRLAEFGAACEGLNIYTYWEPENPENNKAFYNPLVYLFRGIHNGNDKLIILVQFKTVHMGAWFSALERDHLIEGSVIWILNNQGESHRFMSIICSEAMNFAQELTQDKMLGIGWNAHAYYIYNPQANPDPTHEDFISFRRFVLSTDRKELIGLNWNAKSTYNGRPFIKNGTTRSGFYTQSQELDLSEARIKTNHQSGLYYYMFGIKNHVFLLNSFSAIFLISLTGILIIGVAGPQNRRDGPLMIDVQNFDQLTNTFSNSFQAVSDSHLPFLTSIHCGCTFLMQGDGCILEKERLVCLTCGLIKPGLTLIDLKSLLTFSMKQDIEPNLRITVEDDIRRESQGKKANYINSINIIIHDIIPSKDIYPDSILDLRNESISIGFGPQARAEKYRHNIINQNGDSCKATMIYMEGLPDSEIKKTFDDFQALFDSENPTKRRVVIFFRRGAKIISFSDPKAGSITHTEEKDGANILNTQL